MATDQSGIRLRGVTKTFHRRGDAVQALAGVDLDVADGEFVAVIGPSGCGKSTLLRLVAGLVEADSGTVAVGGRSPAAARRAKQFGLVPQTPALLPWRTVRDNITLLNELNRRAASGREPATSRADHLIDVVGLRGFERARPAELSGGMQQRVSLARAFALGAPVLLMDEPFAALDEITRQGMRFLLADIWADAGRGRRADRAVRDPRHRGGGHPGRPGRGALRPARSGRRRRSRRPAPAAGGRPGGHRGVPPPDPVGPRGAQDRPRRGPPAVDAPGMSPR